MLKKLKNWLKREKYDSIPFDELNTPPDMSFEKIEPETMKQLTKMYNGKRKRS